MRNRTHIIVGLFLVASFSLLLWQLRVNVGNNQLTRAAYAQDSINRKEPPVEAQTTIALPPIDAKCALSTKGDANCDNKIDSNDYTVWRGQYKKGKIMGDADFNDDGTVDMKDFEIWRRGMASVTPAPPGCHYEEVTCAKAPCDPVLVCTTPTISPTCIPLPACVNDPVRPCAIRPAPGVVYCPPTTPTPTLSTPPITLTPLPTILIATPILEDVPACSECGYKDACKGNCPDILTCPATCTIDGKSNPNCETTPIGGSCDIQ